MTEPECKSNDRSGADSDLKVQRSKDTTTMFRPIGPAELVLLKQNDFSEWPDRFPDQPIFYPVVNRQYAREIARDWNVPESGSGFVTKFYVRNEFADKFAVQRVGNNYHLEWWIPSEQLRELNQNIVGKIEIIDSFAKNMHTEGLVEIQALSEIRLPRKKFEQFYETSIEWIDLKARDLARSMGSEYIHLTCELRESPDQSTFWSVFLLPNKDGEFGLSRINVAAIHGTPLENIMNSSSLKLFAGSRHIASINV